jgi:hypothetical protein
MAEMDFSRNVPATAQGEALPKPYHRTVTPEITNFPDIQSALTQYAKASNWMSAIGSEVAARASNEIATRIGSELGKNPQGDLGMTFTEFDKAMKESYKTQAQATLGLQANKLITDANIEAAKATRITPALIAKTQSNVSLGLKNIFKNAPAEIVPHLEYQYSTQMLHQSADLTDRMIREQKQDQKNTLDLSNNKNAEQAYSLAMRGDFDAANAVIENTKRANESGYHTRIISPEAAKTATDTVRKSALSGKLINQYEKAKAEGKGEEYLKDLAEGKIIDKSSPDYMPVTNNTLQYVNHQNSLRSQDEQLRIAQFSNAVALNPVNAGLQLQDLKENVSPVAYERAQLHYINAMKTFDKQQKDTNDVLSSWNDPGSFARLTDKAVNKGFDTLVTKYVKSQQEKNTPISQDDAEVQVAASAGGKVPVFNETLQNKIHSASPQMMDSAAIQIQNLRRMNAEHALSGLNEKDKGIIEQYKSLRDSLPPEEAAKIAIQNANQDPDTQKMNQERWSSFVKRQTNNSAIAPQDFALKQVGLKKDDFMNPGIANEYGNLILQKYATFYQNLNGDQQNALKLVKEEVEQNFGYTGVNGSKVKTLHPIEKVLGYEENSDVVPYIQQDVIMNLNKNMSPLKEAYDAKKSDTFWEVVPHNMRNTAFIGSRYEPIQIKRHIRQGNTVKTDTYDVVLIGNSFNWDVALNTSSGIRPITQIAPYLGINTYTPDKSAIDAAYLKHKQYGT